MKYSIAPEGVLSLCIGTKFSSTFIALQQLLIVIPYRALT